MRVIFILILLFSVAFSKASSFEVVGYILDSTNSKPLPGATVRLEGTNYGAIADKKGFFALKKIPKGKYFFIVSYVGYSAQRVLVSISNNDTLVFRLLPKIIRTDELIVSATKRIQTVQEVPVSVSVVPNEFLSNRNYARFDEALRYVPGVIVNKDNINIRGSSGFSFGVGSRVAYLIDGIPMLSGDNADPKYDIIPNDAVSRVEIVKGAGSGLYGSSAIGGVVNVLTREPTDTLTYSIKLQSGIYTKPKYEQWIYTDKLTTKTVVSGFASSDLKLFRFLASFNFVNDESYRQFDKSTRGNLFVKLNRNLGTYGKITLLGFYSTDKRNDWVYWNSLDSATRPPTGTDLSRYLISSKANLSLDAKFIFSPNTFANLKSSIYNTSLETKLDPSHREYRKTDAYSFNNEAQFNTHFGNNSLLTYGISVTNNFVNSNIYGNNKQNLFSAFAQLELTRFWNSTINFGGRLDIEKTDSAKRYIEFSPKFGITHFIDKEKSIRLSVGRGFRSPSLAERFASVKYGGFEVVPNFDLKPEVSWSAELGTLLEFDTPVLPVILDFSVFYSYYNDLIEPTFKQETRPIIIFDNITRAQIWGSEISLKTMIFKKVFFQLGATFLEPKDLKDMQVLKYRSKFSLIASLGVPLGIFTTNFDFRYISKIVRVDEMLRLQVPDYDALVPIYVLDFTIGCDLTKFRLPLNLQLSIQNALDYYYAEMVGNLAPTRLISFRIQYSK
jgi:iron complex outermembrane receptor protein